MTPCFCAQCFLSFSFFLNHSFQGQAVLSVISQPGAYESTAVKNINKSGCRQSRLLFYFYPDNLDKRNREGSENLQIVQHYPAEDVDKTTHCMSQTILKP